MPARLPFPHLDERPSIFDGLLFDFWWDLDRLHALELPDASLPLTDLVWQLDLPWWRDGQRSFRVSPRQVAADPARYRAQFNRTMASDLTWPLIVRRLPGQVVILDGVHRLLKAELAGVEELAVAVFDDSLIPSILHNDT
jgi:hypothetical protein